MIGHTLKSHVEAFAARLRRSARLLELARTGRLTPDMVVAYQTGLRYVIAHTEPHLELARARAVELRNARLARFFAHKLEEERGHERWAEADLLRSLRLFGIGRPQQPAPAAIELAAFLQRTIERDPTCYLAYIFLTEYFAVLTGPEWLELLRERCGVPSDAMTVISKHVELDKGHVAEALLEFDELVVDERYLPMLEDTLFRSMAYLERFYDELCDTPSAMTAGYPAAG